MNKLKYIGEIKMPIYDSNYEDSTINNFKEAFTSKPRIHINALYEDQAKILDLAYMHYEKYPTKALIIKIPTGGGKTLVGLCIADYFRNHDYKVLYVCPSQILLEQTHKFAQQTHFNTVLFFGKNTEYKQADLEQYKSGTSIGITNYDTILAMHGRHPLYNERIVIIFDDAHFGEELINEKYSLEITSANHSELFDRLVKNFNINLESIEEDKIEANLYDPILYQLKNIRLKNTLDEYINSTDVHDDLYWNYKYKCKEKLHTMELYYSKDTLYFSPRYPDLYDHPVINKNSTKRILLTATLGYDDKELGLYFGIPENKVQIIDIPENNTTLNGTRLIFDVFSKYNTILPMVETIKNICSSIDNNIDSNIIILSSSKLESDSIIDTLKNTVLNYSIVTDNKNLSSNKNSILVLANKYNGLDFAGTKNSILLIGNEPKAISLKDQYLRNKFHKNILNVKFIKRFLQSLGRCTREDKERAIILIYGDMARYLESPELSSEIRIEFQHAHSIIDPKNNILQEITEISKTFLDKNNSDGNNIELKIRSKKSKNNFQRDEKSNSQEAKDWDITLYNTNNFFIRGNYNKVFENIQTFVNSICTDDLDKDQKTYYEYILKYYISILFYITVNSKKDYQKISLILKKILEQAPNIIPSDSYKIFKDYIKFDVVLSKTQLQDINQFDILTRNKLEVFIQNYFEYIGYTVSRIPDKNMDFTISLDESNILLIECKLEKKKAELSQADIGQFIKNVNEKKNTTPSLNQKNIKYAFLLPEFSNKNSIAQPIKPYLPEYPVYIIPHSLLQAILCDIYSIYKESSKLRDDKYELFVELSKKQLLPDSIIERLFKESNLL